MRIREPFHLFAIRSQPYLEAIARFYSLQKVPNHVSVLIIHNTLHLLPDMSIKFIYVKRGHIIYLIFSIIDDTLNFMIAPLEENTDN